ncbi:response regulator [Tessaracoccus sp. OS52]|uniref:response regulator n=1 Tax=Tessaracoccus sp. OS52 TaxID=2886691 RepID=UPI001D12BB0F|nr:response regulator [Tessaracoccus sp. OS52]MCC2593428.1 response regulator [Tessaracoccus sp. OS52]
MSEPRETAKVLLFSDDRTVREEVRLTLGRRVARDLPEIEIFEVATGPALLRTLDAGGTDYSLIIMDGDAQPEGGFGLAHQVKQEYANCPPVLLLIRRVADAWLGTWTEAEALSPFPVDPIRLPEQVAELLRAGKAVAK